MCLPFASVPAAACLEQDLQCQSPAFNLLLFPLACWESECESGVCLVWRNLFVVGVTSVVSSDCKQLHTLRDIAETWCTCVSSAPGLYLFIFESLCLGTVQERTVGPQQGRDGAGSGEDLSVQRGQAQPPLLTLLYLTGSSGSPNVLLSPSAWRAFHTSKAGGKCAMFVCEMCPDNLILTAENA